jgi:hypothetical protein
MGERAIEFYKRAAASLAKLRHGSAKLFTDQILKLWEILATRQDDTDWDIRKLNKRVRELETEVRQMKDSRGD